MPSNDWAGALGVPHRPAKMIIQVVVLRTRRPPRRATGRIVEVCVGVTIRSLGATPSPVGHQPRTYDPGAVYTVAARCARGGTEMRGRVMPAGTLVVGLRS